MDIPVLQKPQTCKSCKTFFMQPDQITTWTSLCPKCSFKSLDAYEVWKKTRAANDKPEAKRDSEREDAYAHYFVTFTSSDYQEPDVFLKRLQRVLKSNVYPVESYYGQFEITEAGRLHLHCVFKHRLKTDGRGLPRYPCKQHYSTCNGGELIKKQRIADQQNLTNVFAYIDKPETKANIPAVGEKFSY